MGSAAGLTTAKIQAVADPQAATTVFDERERLVLDYAAAMTATPADVPESLFAALQRHFSAAQLVELTSAIAWEQYRARFNRALAVPAQGFAKDEVCVVPPRRGS